MAVESALLFETPEQVFTRVFSEMKPRTRPPAIHIEFCPFANPDSFARLENGEIRIRIADLLQGAPAPILEALAWILLGKLFRKPAPAAFSKRYRLYLNRRDMLRRIHLVRQIRGRKFLSSPQGQVYDLETLFEEINLAYFSGLMARPQLGWSRGASRTHLGHYDPSHNAIILSRALDRPEVPRVVVEYVLFHEMLHLRFPVQAGGVRRRVHTREFREAEKQFAKYREARELLKMMGSIGD